MILFVFNCLSNVIMYFNIVLNLVHFLKDSCVFSLKKSALVIFPRCALLWSQETRQKFSPLTEIMLLKCEYNSNIDKSVRLIDDPIVLSHLYSVYVVSAILCTVM